MKKSSLPQQDLAVQRPRSIRIATIVALVLTVVLLAATMILAYWAVTGRDVLEVKNDPVPVRTIRPHPTADGVVILKVDYCKKIKATGDIRISFVGKSREVFLPKTTDNQPPRCDKPEIPVLIPYDIAPGMYHVHFRVSYKTNPVRTVVEEFDSQPFEIVTETK